MPHATYSAYQVAQARTPPSRARASIVGMDSLAPLAHRMPYTAAFPKALGTGLLISTPRPITAELRGETAGSRDARIARIVGTGCVALRDAR